MLWAELRGMRQHGFAFRRQAAVGPFIADFLCRKAKLVVEVDGRHHDRPEQMAHDAKRDAYLVAHGYSVIRIPARDIWSDLSWVVRDIEMQLGL